ncbi:hypothetical protein LJR016_005372 [Devosia sp. LjRoot16]|uniref:hypothetical protein n=1 Tax=Devosia sp. LjRoot16 TaxID=3342271 RepID=UPI003ED00BE2
MQDPRKSAKPKSRRPLALAAIPVAGLLFLGSTVTSQAFFTPDVVAQIDHFVECFGWMITDPELHQANCSPARNFTNEWLGSGSGSGSGGIVIVTTTTTTTTTTTFTGTVN